MIESVSFIPREARQLPIGHSTRDSKTTVYTLGDFVYLHVQQAQTATIFKFDKYVMYALLQKL